jgi:hypothetical protein
MDGHDPKISLLPVAEGGAAIQPMRGGGKKGKKDKSMKGGGAAEDHIANQFLKRVLSALETESKEFTANDKTLTKTTETTLR